MLRLFLAGQLLLLAQTSLALTNDGPLPNEKVIGPTTLPSQCQTGISYFDVGERAKKGDFMYIATSDKAVFVNGQWALVCPSGTVVGYADLVTIVAIDNTLRITCESSGWWLKSASNSIGITLPSVNVGCFLEKKVAGRGNLGTLETTCPPGPELQLFDGTESIIVANEAKYQFTLPITSNEGEKLELTCPSGFLTGYKQGDTMLSVEPLKITCEGKGWWVKGPNRADGLLQSVKIGCFKEIPTSTPAAPVSTIPKQACGCRYEPSTCRTCDLQKLSVLDGHEATSGRCTLGCAKGYIFAGGEMNMISCQGGNWTGSSRTSMKTVPMSSPFGYITTSCVPEPTPAATSSLKYETFNCVGCDATKVTPISSSKSAAGCVLACDRNYRLLVQDTSLKVTRAQEAVAEQGGTFSVYALGNVTTPIVMSSTGLKFSCELATNNTAPVVLTPVCTGLRLFDGTEPIIATNAALYQFTSTAPSLVGGRDEFVCPSDASIGYAQGDTILSVDPNMTITCESKGWWVKSPSRVDGLLQSVKVGCFKEIPTSIPSVPVSTIPKQACGCRYEPSSCRTCDLQKLFVLDGHGATSGRCTLGCAKGYILEGGQMNTMSCQGGQWFGSSRSSLGSVALSGPFGYITTSCVPEPTPAATCSVTYGTFNCVGCDAAKIILISSTKSKPGCVLSCDKNYRLLIQEANLKVIRVQEAVASLTNFSVYLLGDVKTPHGKERTVKFSCEPATSNTAPVVLTPVCTGNNLLVGTEPLITANAAVYQFVKTAPSLVGGRYELVCPSNASIGYAQADTILSVDPNMTITCDSKGWWVQSPGRVNGLLQAVKVGCFREIPTSIPSAPFSAIPKQACGCWYEPSYCRTCNLQKLFVLEGHGALSARCTLGCAKGYIFEGGRMNMISCQGGNWLGSSRTSVSAFAVPSGPFGYITTSCVPEPTPATCSLQYGTFNCVGCDATKLFPISSSKSPGRCVLSCDKNYRLLVQDAFLKVRRAQEAVYGAGSFWVYLLTYSLNTPFVMSSNGLKFSCEPATPVINNRVLLL